MSKNVGELLVEFIKAMIMKYSNYIRLAQVLDVSANDPSNPVPYISVRYLDGAGEQTRVLLAKRTGTRIPKVGEIVIVGFRPQDSPIFLGILETSKEVLSQLGENDVHIGFTEDNYIRYSDSEKLTTIKSNSKIDGDLEISGKIKVSGGSKNVARVGDTVSVTVYVPGVGNCTGTGTITSGSDEVKIE